MYFDNYIFFNAFKFLLCKINKLSMILVSWMAKSHTRQLYTPWIRRDIFGLKKKYRNFQLVIDRYDRYDFFMFRLSFFSFKSSSWYCRMLCCFPLNHPMTSSLLRNTGEESTFAGLQVKIQQCQNIMYAKIFFE